MNRTISPLTFPKVQGLAKRAFVRCALVVLGAAMLTTPAQGAFHLWGIREIYSDSSGSLQFIELVDTFGGQNFVGSMNVQVVNVGATQTHTFTLPANALAGNTFNQALLFGTAGLQAAGGPVPDYIIPNNFLFTAGGTINFFGLNSGPYSALPTDGLLSRTWTGGNALNSPQNYAGQIGVVPEPATLALLGFGGVSLCLLRRRSS